MKRIIAAALARPLFSLAPVSTQTLASTGPSARQILNRAYQYERKWQSVWLSTESTYHVSGNAKGKVNHIAAVSFISGWTSLSGQPESSMSGTDDLTLNGKKTEAFPNYVVVGSRLAMEPNEFNPWTCGSLKLLRLFLVWTPTVWKPRNYACNKVKLLRASPSNSGPQVSVVRVYESYLLTGMFVKAHIALSFDRSPYALVQITETGSESKGSTHVSMTNTGFFRTFGGPRAVQLPGGC